MGLAVARTSALDHRFTDFQFVTNAFGHETDVDFTYGSFLEKYDIVWDDVAGLVTSITRTLEDKP